MWLLFAILAAITAALSVTFSKAGVKNVDSNLGFAIQAVLILIISWGTVIWQKSYAEITKLDKRTWIFLLLAGVTTGLSSLFQFRALKNGQASIVSSIERSSLVFTILLAILFLKEKANWQIITGAALIIGGAVLVATGRQQGQ